MSCSRLRIGVVAPASRIEPTIAEEVKALAADRFGERAPELVVHPQCHYVCGHFAGEDEVRANAFVEVANDPALDAIWFARGGYGACRLADQVVGRLGDAARTKTYLGYSDIGSFLGLLYRHGIGRPVHGPMLGDITRNGGEAAVARSLAFLVDGDKSGIEPNALGKAPVVAFNITILSQMLGTPLEPDLTDHVIMLEDVSEYMYRIDRALFHITSNAAIRRAAGIMLGRCSDIPENDPDFGQDEEQVVRYWCKKSGVAYLGRADIGHDSENKIVPFGSAAP